MTPSSHLNFANKDLRNRSFKGQDLTGTDFSGSDIRGCDFSEAILVKANFSRVRTGQSHQRVHTLILRSGAVAVAVAIAGATAGAIGVAGTGVVAGAITKAEAGVMAGAIAGAAAVVGCGGLVTFSQGDFVRSLILLVCSLVGFGVAAILFFETVEQIETLSRTSFRNADLTEAKFDGAIIQNTDFSGKITTCS